jgi:CheY-like chemotaxis protein
MSPGEKRRVRRNFHPSEETNLSKVLIVDDSVSVRKALERLLAPRDFDVTSASSAEHALELIATTVPDLIIADVVMPGMTGFELCQRLKAMPSYKQIPVILISGIVDSAVQSQARDSGAESVVSKPFTPEDLFPQIDKAMAKALTLNASSTATVIEPVVERQRQRFTLKPICCHSSRKPRSKPL